MTIKYEPSLCILLKYLKYKCIFFCKSANISLKLIFASYDFPSYQYNMLISSNKIILLFSLLTLYFLLNFLRPESKRLIKYDVILNISHYYMQFAYHITIIIMGL